MPITSGTVIANIPAGVATAISSGVSNAASTSTDNVVTWEESGLLNAVHWWDFSNLGSMVGNITTITDLISGAVMTTIGSPVNRVTTLGTQGITAGFANPSGGGATTRMTTSAFAISAQPFWVSWVGHATAAAVFFNLGNSGNGPAANNNLDTSIRTRAGVGTVLDGSGVGTVAAPRVCYAEYNGASSKLYLDGILAVSGNTGSLTPLTLVTLFNNYLGGNGGSIYIGEILMGTGTNTTGAVTTEYNRIRTKWGL